LQHDAKDATINGLVFVDIQRLPDHLCSRIKTSSLKRIRQHALQDL
jgi:hypothetical protein